MEVTRDQLAEIMYRVRDSVCTGSSSLTPVDEFDPVATVTMSPVMPSERLLVRELVPDNTYQESVTLRGYVTARGTNDDLDTPPPMEDVSDALLSEVFDIGFDYWQDFPDNYSNLTVRFREAIQERSIWLQHEAKFRYEMRDAVFGVIGIGGIEIGNAPFRTGFSLGSSTFSDNIPSETPTIYAAYEVAGGGTWGGVNLAFDGRVAFVDNDNSGNPLSPQNKLYVGITFEVELAGQVIEGLFITANKTLPFWSASGTKVDERLILKLSGGIEVSCPLYGFAIEFDGGRIPLDSAEGTYSGTDWVFEATEWWPYAGEWNPNTGERL
jgi:hypothetical protein